MFFIWMYLDCWRKTFLANCRNSMMNSSLFDDKQITNIQLMNYDMSSSNIVLLLYTNYAIQTTIVNDYYWSKRRRKRRKKRIGETLVASHRSQWWSSSFSYLSMENLLGVASLSHTSCLYLQNVIKKWICTKENEKISLFYIDLSDICLLLYRLSSSCSYSLRASYYVNE
jgi:hypothetical protein